MDIFWVVGFERYSQNSDVLITKKVWEFLGADRTYCWLLAFDFFWDHLDVAQEVLRDSQNGSCLRSETVLELHGFRWTIWSHTKKYPLVI